MKSDQSAYLRKLQDPRWQRKRLEVMQYADFRCQICGAKNRMLHCHHSYYERGKNPWDYPDGAIICICSDCHRLIHGRGGDSEPIGFTALADKPRLQPILRLLALVFVHAPHATTFIEVEEWRELITLEQGSAVLRYILWPANVELSSQEHAELAAIEAEKCPSNPEILARDVWIQLRIRAKRRECENWQAQLRDNPAMPHAEADDLVRAIMESHKIIIALGKELSPRPEV